MVLKEAPDWLIFVSGLNYQLDLTPIFKSPLNYSIPNKLVYTGHLYNFSWPNPSWKLSYDQFKKRLFNEQTYVRAFGYPYLIGEFGNNSQDTYWNYLIRYLKETGIDWTYWPIDGFKGNPLDPSQDETYGLFDHEFSGPRHPEMVADLKSIVSIQHQKPHHIEFKKIQSA